MAVGEEGGREDEQREAIATKGKKGEEAEEAASTPLSEMSPLRLNENNKEVSIDSSDIHYVSAIPVEGSQQRSGSGGRLLDSIDERTENDRLTSITRSAPSSSLQQQSSEELVPLTEVTLQAIKQNLIPGVCCFILAFAILLMYFNVPEVTEILDE